MDINEKPQAHFSHKIFFRTLKECESEEKEELVHQPNRIFLHLDLNDGICDSVTFIGWNSQYSSERHWRRFSNLKTLGTGFPTV